MPGWARLLRAHTHRRHATTKTEGCMFRRSSICIAALTLLFFGSAAQAFDESKYPDWSGQWRLGEPGPPRYDPSKPGAGLRQEAPLTEEYKKVLEASMADQKDGPGRDPSYTCLSPGMPRIMNVYDPMEIIVTEKTTHILIQHVHDSRRIFTDGRDWPKELEPTFAGYSIGKWLDTDGDGKFDTLEVETRGFRGPRAYDATGLPLHVDNESVIKERIHLDKNNPKILVDEITTIDNALTRPWTAIKTYRQVDVKQPVWPETVCGADNAQVDIGGQNYMFSAEGLLMPARKGKNRRTRHFKVPAK
jgi:hypothetical protein